MIIGGGDAPLTALASGVTDSDTAGISLGTAGQIIMPMDSFEVEADLRLHTMAFARPGQWFIMGAVLAAGYNLRWLLENIIKTEQKDGDFLKSREDAVREIPPGSQGLIYLPYILGERSPINDPQASASFWGLKDFHEQQHLLRAVMEGVAMAMRWNLSLMRATAGEPEKIYLSGGGARSEVWPQILADILKIPVYSCDRLRGPAYGAALLAGESAGLINGVKKALEQNRKNYKCFQPADENSSLYGEMFEIYQDLYRDNRDKMHRLNDLRRSLD
ncbi:xylulokinase [Halarsenatibacter silvermanii]|uniref:FGGY family of carbohydrate kinases, C-terminal domain n=1 Tax=Halarsenatibacter silvermanii TaxID=321763 RepID=A0A1G9LTE3_9FIRM|nr:FGGY-family carbohydrate kinase [Halarsenatibacter silvermanii]SDL65280.1 FGGY family of carbohydrate kinases, C-terminal domain [Halarsenatibacter silvermanii]